MSKTINDLNERGSRALPLLSGLLEQRRESGLLEMGVLGAGVSQSPLFHDAKAQAVSEGPALINMFQEIVLHRVKSLRIGPLDLAGGGCEHGVEEMTQQMAAIPGDKQRGCFIQNVVSGDAPPLLRCARLEDPSRLRMPVVPLDKQGVKAAVFTSDSSIRFKCNFNFKLNLT